MIKKKNKFSCYMIMTHTILTELIRTGGIWKDDNKSL